MNAQSWGLVGVRGSLGRSAVFPPNNVPADIDGAHEFVQVEYGGGGAGSSIGLASDGTVWAWGDNVTGLLDNGSGADILSHATPIQIASLSNIVSVAATGSNFFALDGSGNLWGWAANNNGYLGLGDFIDRTTPALCNTGVVFVSHNSSATLVIKTGGVVQTCGTNSSGEIANGTTTFRFNTWQTVTPGAGTVISAAGHQTGHYLLMADGTVLGAGGSAQGQLGFITASPTTSWVTVPITHVVRIGGGGQCGFFVKDDGTAWAIGYNQQGRLGVGQTQASLPNSASAIQMVFPTGVQPVQFNKSYGGGGGACIALGSDHKVYTWGQGTNGQMGNGTNTTENDTPIQNPNIVSADWVGGLGFNLFAGTLPTAAGRARRAWAAVIG